MTIGKTIIPEGWRELWKEEDYQYGDRYCYYSAGSKHLEDWPEVPFDHHNTSVQLWSCPSITRLSAVKPAYPSHFRFSGDSVEFEFTKGMILLTLEKYKEIKERVVCLIFKEGSQLITRVKYEEFAALGLDLIARERSPEKEEEMKKIPEGWEELIDKNTVLKDDDRYHSVHAVSWGEDTWRNRLDAQKLAGPIGTHLVVGDWTGTWIRKKPEPKASLPIWDLKTFLDNGWRMLNDNENILEEDLYQQDSQLYAKCETYLEVKSRNSNLGKYSTAREWKGAWIRKGEAPKLAAASSRSYPADAAPIGFERVSVGGTIQHNDLVLKNENCDPRQFSEYEYVGISHPRLGWTINKNTWAVIRKVPTDIPMPEETVPVKAPTKKPPVKKVAVAKNLEKVPPENFSKEVILTKKEKEMATPVNTNPGFFSALKASAVSNAKTAASTTLAEKITDLVINRLPEKLQFLSKMVPRPVLVFGVSSAVYAAALRFDLPARERVRDVSKYALDGSMYEAMRLLTRLLEPIFQAIKDMVPSDIGQLIDEASGEADATPPVSAKTAVKKALAEAE